LAVRTTREKKRAKSRALEEPNCSLDIMDEGRGRKIQNGKGAGTSVTAFRTGKKIGERLEFASRSRRKKKKKSLKKMTSPAPLTQVYAVTYRPPRSGKTEKKGGPTKSSLW